MYYIDLPKVAPNAHFQVRFISTSDSEDDSEAIEYINSLKKGESDGYLALFSTFMESGTDKFTYANFHPIKIEKGLYQFLKGRHRLVCFFDEDDTIVICTHGFLKKTDPSPKDQIQHADKLKMKYFSAKEDGGLHILGVSHEQFFRKFL